MRLMDSLEILYYKKGKEFGVLEKRMKEIFNETGVSLEPVNSELIGRIFLKINVLEEGEEVPSFVIKALTPEENAVDLPLGEWADLKNVFVEEVDYLDSYGDMRILSEKNWYTIYVPYFSVKEKSRNEVVKEFMRYFLESKGWNPEEYAFSVQEIDNLF
ncbi:DUF3855 domain-containing protein [Thermotoga sp. 38H-to]|uniref:DUF3855 domain-containing protein n=1 Tax=Thermotoga sp. 38H-to TaxID=1755812 RepID=UPI0013E9B9AA|nr:DUF3855 domain-containing protein [Thermotoga sp. 38H-to]KAF2959653.1 hypothetical protein AS158_04180 [Thermotoga sp. 38H-to]